MSTGLELASDWTSNRLKVPSSGLVGSFSAVNPSVSDVERPWTVMILPLMLTLRLVPWITPLLAEVQVYKLAPRNTVTDSTATGVSSRR